MPIAQCFSPDIPALMIDPFDEEVLRNPEPYYASLREAGPIVVIEKYGILASGRHKETQEIFADATRFVSSRGIGLSDFKVEKPWRQPSIILEADPPEHTRARLVMTRTLSPHAVVVLKEKFEEEAELLINRLIEKHEFDAVRDLAEAFPLRVFPDAVGIAGEGREALLAYGRMVFNAVGPDNAVRRRAFANAASIVAWIERHCARSAISSNGFAATIYAAAETGELTEQEAGLLVRSLLSAGIDTTVAALGSAMFCFATNPDQYAVLRGDPQLARQAFDEVLRFTSPVHSFFRTANQNTEVSGIPITEGSKILCVLGSANRDPAKWPDASKFDIARKPTGHLAFGTGIHSCVGQAVARLEAEAVLTSLATKVETIQLTDDAVWRPGNSVRALKRLPLRVTRRA
jgi:4-methoxybenzoate monooxygenase (O-demethylating)